MKHNNQKDKKLSGIYLSLIFVFLAFINSTRAGDNFSAGCAIDLNYLTRDYDTQISTKNIELRGTYLMDDELWVAVIAQNTTNLDTYEVEVIYDQSQMTFVEGYEDNPFSEVVNLLKKNNGMTVGFQAVESSPGKVIIANALSGTNTDEAPEGSGIISLLKFKALKDISDIHLSLSKVNFLDSNNSHDSIKNLIFPSAKDIPKDLNLNEKADLADVIILLQMLSGMNSMNQ
ncbi:conserved hypothetical protein, secreted [Candidatus Magnetomorum sp. HK-1]|nr:conserved hypothetical protein, secreted [Candidatus Magnetomorum sp. HK-1]